MISFRIRLYNCYRSDL